jgi:hypothetical protein
MGFFMHETPGSLNSTKEISTSLLLNKKFYIFPRQNFVR